MSTVLLGMGETTTAAPTTVTTAVLHQLTRDKKKKAPEVQPSDDTENKKQKTARKKPQKKKGSTKNQTKRAGSGTARKEPPKKKKVESVGSTKEKQQKKKKQPSERSEKGSMAVASPKKTRHQKMELTPPQDKTKKPSIDLVCNHDSVGGFIVMDQATYFTKGYLKKHPTAVRCCAMKGCTNSEFGDSYKVGARQPVHACSNAHDAYHECMHAYCKPCFLKFQATCGDCSMSRIISTRRGRSSTTK